MCMQRWMGEKVLPELASALVPFQAHAASFWTSLQLLLSCEMTRVTSVTGVLWPMMMHYAQAFIQATLAL